MNLLGIHFEPVGMCRTQYIYIYIYIYSQCVYIYIYMCIYLHAYYMFVKPEPTIFPSLVVRWLVCCSFAHTKKSLDFAIRQENTLILSGPITSDPQRVLEIRVPPVNFHLKNGTLLMMMTMTMTVMMKIMLYLYISVQVYMFISMLVCICVCIFI